MTAHVLARRCAVVGLSRSLACPNQRTSSLPACTTCDSHPTRCNRWPGYPFSCSHGRRTGICASHESIGSIPTMRRIRLGNLHVSSAPLEMTTIHGRLPNRSFLERPSTKGLLPVLGITRSLILLRRFSHDRTNETNRSIRRIVGIFRRRPPPHRSMVSRVVSGRKWLDDGADGADDG